MNRYDVIITPDAENDLYEISSYISLTLQSPDTAASYAGLIKEKLLSLRNNPGRYRLIDEEPWRSMGIHRMNVRNFAVFYVVLEEYKEVYIQNIIYQKRDLTHILSDFYLSSNDQ